MLFRRNANGEWTELGRLFAPDGSESDEFSLSMALSDDATLALIGASSATVEGHPQAGAAYIFALGPDSDGDGVPDPCECPADADDDGQVDLGDLASLLVHYGTRDRMRRTDGNLDGDGDVDLADLAMLLAEFGVICD